MSHRRRFHGFFRPKQRPKHVYLTRALLDQFSADDVQRLIDHKDRFLKYHWDYYNDLEFQRSKIADKIKESLLGSTQKDFIFKNGSEQ